MALYYKDHLNHSVGVAGCNLRNHIECRRDECRDQFHYHYQTLILYGFVTGADEGVMYLSQVFVETYETSFSARQAEHENIPIDAPLRI